MYLSITIKTLNEVFEEVKSESFKFIKKYEDIPMIDISGTNGRVYIQLIQKLEKY